MVRRGFRPLVLAVIFALAAASAVLAQTGNGLITGRVIDQQGAAVVGAHVTATNVATQVKTNSITNQAGIYELLDLLPGNYEVEASAPSFKKVVRPKVTVQVEDKIGLDFSLEVGGINETLTITADASPLRTEDAQTGEVVTEKMIQTLPIIASPDRRDPFGLMTLSGEVQGDGGRVGYNQGSNNYNDTTINGGRTTGIDYLVDGVSVVQGRAHNVSEATPGVEDVAEFKVITNGISAEYGRVSGGGVALVTKSGSNQFHGQLFEYMFNDMFNANTWDNDTILASNPAAGVGKKPHFRQNDFGFAIGGPVILPHVYNGKGKTFFFVDWEDIHYRETGSLNFASLPADGSQPGTTNERAGDLTDIGVAAGDPKNPYPLMYDPNGAVSPTPVLAPDGTLQYEHLTLLGGDGRHVPTINPVSAAILALTPKPNHAPATGSSIQNDFIAPADVSQITPSYSIRVDQNFSDKDKLFGRFSYYHKDQETARWAGPLSTSGSQRVNGAFGATLSYDHTFSPTLLMNVTVGGNFTPFLGGNLLPPGFTNTSLGLDATTLSILGNQNIPYLNAEEQLGQSAQLLASAGASLRNSTNGALTAAITKILNRHTVKVGFEGRRYYDSFNNSGGGTIYTDSNGVGQFENIDQTWTPQGDANAFGSFLLGLTDMYQTNGFVDYQLAQNYYAAYVQDDFKVSSKLTVNLGLRWDMETPTTERHNKLYFWDPNAPAPFTPDAGYNFDNALAAAGLTPAQISQVQTPSWVTNGFPKGAVRIAATPEHPSRYGQSYHPYQFAPRLGVAYQVNKDTVVRASFGVMYLPTTGWASAFAGSTGDTLAPAAGGNYSIWHLNQFGFNTSIGTFQNPYTQASIVNYTRSNAIANLQSTGGVGAGGLSATAHMPHEYTWSLGIQRQLPWKFVVQADYSANASNTLMAKNVVSRFPKSLYVPANANLYYTQVASPTASSTNTGATLPLAELEFPYPYFNSVYEDGDNIGSANYESGNLRVQRRFSNGLQILFNYTYSKLLDDVGGPEASNGGSNSGFGEGGKIPQAVDPVTATYGFSPLDQTHRISAFFNYQFPFGRGRMLMSNPTGLGGNLLDGVIGGWEISGESVWHSGSPIIIQPAGSQPDASVRIDDVYASYAPGATYSDLKGPGFGGPSSVRITKLQSAVPAGVALPINLKALNPFCPPAPQPCSSPTYSQSFTYGTLPSIYAGVRNPGNVNASLSLMKSFPILSADGSRYLQFRMEAANIANHPGLGNYNTTVGSENFGSITSTANTERHIQLSLRFVF